MNCVNEVVCPYVSNVAEELDLPFAQKWLVIFDCFRGQITEKFRDLLKSKRILYSIIAPKLYKLQPMDLSLKIFLSSNFTSTTLRK